MMNKNGDQNLNVYVYLSSRVLPDENGRAGISLVIFVLSPSSWTM